MKRLSLFASLATLVIALSAGVAYACDYDKTTTAAAETAPAEVVLTTLVVSDATCGSCIVPIREELTALNGVTSVESGEVFTDVVVKSVKGKVTNDALVAAVKKAGYTATVKVDKAEEDRRS